MSQGNDFANYASSVEDRSAASEDVWFVAVSSDDIKQMNVDQLDEAFRLGVINAQTAVWTEGMAAWAPLGEVADLDSADVSSAEQDAAHQGAADQESDGSAGPASAPFDAAAFASSASTSSAEGLPSQRRTNPGWQNPFDAPESVAPAASKGGMFSSAMSAGSSFAEPGRTSSRSSSMGPSSFAPVTASYAPSAGGSLGQSTGPVALNVDEDMPAVNRGRRFRPERWLLAAAGVVAVGVIGFNNADLLSSKSMAAAEKQASAAALVAHPYELGADKSAKSGSNPSAASKGGELAAASKTAEPDDGKDAPIGSLKGEAGEDEAAAPAASPEPVAKLGSTAKGSAPKDSASKDSASKDSASKDPDSKDSADKDLRGGFAKAFSKNAPAGKPAKAGKSARAAKAVAHKTPSRASASAKPKKGGVARAASAFDPLNGSLP